METQQPAVLKLDGKKDFEKKVFDAAVKDGFNNFETDNVSKVLEAQKKAGKDVEDYKSQLEQQRYKQDCRKRALDLAHSQVTSSVFQRFIEDNKFVSVDENSVSDKAPVIADDILMGLADKYYQWLISIPETK